ncbi:MAG: hypothetical protein V4677_13760 [Bacteroidota bacterium]
MKLIGIFTLLMLFLVISCKKERTCECSNSSGTYIGGTIDGTKSYAKKVCKDLSAGETTCKLKD